MITLDMEQGSLEWMQARAGKPSASNFDKLVTMKGELSKQAQKYMYQLAGETLAGCKEEGYTNANMQRGIELEQSAREYYELINEVSVEEVGFCMDEKSRYGASPDGLVGEEGLLEIKCPTMAVHIEYLVNGKLPSTYFQQVQGQLLVTGRKWCDFMSYYPDIRPFIVRVERDEEFIKKLETALNEFCDELEKLVEKIK